MTLLPVETSKSRTSGHSPRLSAKIDVCSASSTCGRPSRAIHNTSSAFWPISEVTSDHPLARHAAGQGRAVTLPPQSVTTIEIARVTHPEELAEVRVTILDRPGSAAELFTLAAELGVNIANFEVVHSAEGGRGIAVVLVDAQTADDKAMSITDKWVIGDTNLVIDGTMKKIYDHIRFQKFMSGRGGKEAKRSEEHTSELQSH